MVPGGQPGDHHEGEIPLDGADVGQHMGKAVRGPFQIGIAVFDHALTGLIDGDQRCLVGLECALGDNVEGEIKIVGDLQIEIPARGLVVEA